jgi:hypothetical protein
MLYIVNLTDSIIASRVDLWNLRLFLNLTRIDLTPQELTNWLDRNSVPMCAFMPDRLSESNAQASNHQFFQLLSQMLTQNQVVSLNSISSCGALKNLHQVAFAPFNPTRSRSPGILIFTTNPSTDALLAGAVILNVDLLSTISNGPPSRNWISQEGPPGYSASQHMHNPSPQQLYYA